MKAVGLIKKIIRDLTAKEVGHVCGAAGSGGGDKGNGNDEHAKNNSKSRSSSC